MPQPNAYVDIREDSTQSYANGAKPKLLDAWPPWAFLSSFADPFEEFQLT